MNIKKQVMVFGLTVSMAYTSGGDAVATYPFVLKRHTKGKVVTDFKQQKIVVTIKGRRMLLPGTSDAFMDYREEFGLESVTFADLNFDGYTDIGVLVGIGYGGVNEYRDYFFYVPGTKRYTRQITYASNLTVLDRKSRLLTTQARNGLNQGWDIYRIDSRGGAHRIISILGYWPDSGEGDMLYRYTSDARVKVPRAYFYAKPGHRRSRTYIIKGDKVSLLDLVIEGGKAWVKVAYKSTKKTYRQWMRFSDLSFRDLPEEPS